MPDPNTAVAAPDTQVAPATTAVQPTAAPAEKKYFLEIDDRDRFETQDAAKEGWKNLKSRVLELDPWAKQYDSWKEEFGDGVTPEWVNNQLTKLNEYLLKEQEATKGTQATPAAAPTGLEALPKEWQEHIQFLREKAGVLTKTDIDKMFEERLGPIDQARQAEYDTRVQSAVSEGKSMLVDLLKQGGFSTSEEDVEEIRLDLEDRIVRQSRKNGELVPGSLEHRFINGSSAERKAIVEAEFKKWARHAEAYAQSKNASYAKDKAASMAATPKPVQPGSAAPDGQPKRRLSESELRAGVLARLTGQTS